MKVMMENKINDTARGATYGAWIAIETDTFQIPITIKEIEMKKKWRKKSIEPRKVASNVDTRERNPNSANTTIEIKWLYSRRRLRNI